MSEIRGGDAPPGFLQSHYSEGFWHRTCEDRQVGKEHVIYEDRQVGKVGKNGDAAKDSFILSGPRKINHRRLEEGRIFFFNKNSFFRSPLQRFRGPNLTFGKLPFGKLHIWEVASKEFVTREVAVWKVPNTDAMILYIRALP